MRCPYGQGELPIVTRQVLGLINYPTTDAISLSVMLRLRLAAAVWSMTSRAFRCSDRHKLAIAVLAAVLFWPYLLWPYLQPVRPC